MESTVIISLKNFMPYGSMAVAFSRENSMLTYNDIRTAKDIRLYSDNLLCVISNEENVAYWFSNRGLPWGTRENDSFLKKWNYDPSDGIVVSSEVALQIIAKWESR